MSFSFQIHNLRLTIICMDDQESAAILLEFGVCSYMFFLVTSSELIFFFLIILIHLISSFLHYQFLLFPHAYVDSIDCILLSSLVLGTILLTSSANTLYFSLFCPCCVFDNTLLFFYKLFMIFSKIIYIKIFF